MIDKEGGVVREAQMWEDPNWWRLSKPGLRSVRGEPLGTRPYTMMSFHPGMILAGGSSYCT